MRPTADLDRSGVRPRSVPGSSIAEVAVTAGATFATEGAVSPASWSATGSTTTGSATGSATGSTEPTVRGVTLDSRSVHPGDLYAALPGTRVHGADFVGDAVRAGAAAVLTDPDGARRIASVAGLAARPAVLVADDPRAVLGQVCARVYGDPASALTLLGVTGTNGKTTTSYLLDAVLRAAGRRTGLIGGVQVRVGDHGVPSVRTTPEAPQLHALLAAMREQQVQVCSMEVSSQALAQHRVDAVVVDVAGWTNFSQDHLDLHGDLVGYLAAKQLLLTPQHSRQAVVVVDDEGSRSAAERAEVPVTTLSVDPDAAADWQVGRRPVAGGGTDLRLAGVKEQVELYCPLPGGFNATNAALAAVMLHAAGLSWAQIRDGLAGARGAPGRMERVDAGVSGPLAVVDYAHTPVAVASAVRALAVATAPGDQAAPDDQAAPGDRTGPDRLVVVIGAGGDRDRGKRAAMGQAAAQGAQVVVVTDDNPRGEDPAAIRSAVLQGARRVPGVEVVDVPDRRSAIAEGVRRAGVGGTVLVLGKGHEQGQEVAGEVYPFDDRVEVGAALRQFAVSSQESR
ncbi:MAG: UDP-N-acetylmuramoyl-L-alanyl-D-glutamate--2,6-diaminopimelate ligase [Angustibacter sp.]